MLYSNGGVPIFGPISNTLLNAAPLILGGLAVTVAFRAGLFNIGVQGQLIMGAIAAGYVGFAVSLPPVIHVSWRCSPASLGGAVWGGLVGALKARTGAHEVITTIMLNYVAVVPAGLPADAQRLPAAGLERGDLASRARHAPGCRTCSSRCTPASWSRSPPRSAVWWLLSRSTLGFTLRAVGANAVRGPHRRHERRAQLR